MASINSQLVITLRDLVSKPARAAANAVKGIGTAARSVAGVVPLNAIAGAARGVRTHASNAAGAVSAPLGLLGALGARSVYQFEKVGNAVQSVTEMTAEQRREIEKLTMSIREFGPGDAMQSALELAKTGF